jgi:hypothetical protein
VLVPARPDAAIVRIVPLGGVILVYFGPDHSLGDELVEDDPVDLLRQILEATIAGGLVYAIEPQRGAYREVFTYGDRLERGAINSAPGHGMTERYERRFAPYA